MLIWLIIGIIHLLILSYQDIRHKKLVDDRHNWFMTGATIMLLSHFHHSTKYILFISVVALSLMYFIKKFKLMGEADTKTILWTFTGFGFIGLWSLIPYLILLSTLYVFQAAVNFILCKYLFKRKITNFPAYPLFLVSFILSYWLFV